MHFPVITVTVITKPQVSDTVFPIVSLLQKANKDTHTVLSFTTSYQQVFGIYVVNQKVHKYTNLTCPPTSCNSAVLTGSCSMSVLMAVWSKGQALRCNLFRHILQTVCPQPKLMGRRTVSSKVWVQIGHSRNSVHCGACTGMVIYGDGQSECKCT